MPASNVYVSYSSGSPARNTRVVLSFDNSGVTSAHYTDNTGQAVVQHSATGEAWVIVDGTKRGRFRAPGSVAVTL